ncbi:hypothetical protein FWD07_02965 [Candidatus Saccharibacteria bacterium]|nr:hypothetical protein [Candidatus Saccharibacteria bacterium]
MDENHNQSPDMQPSDQEHLEPNESTDYTSENIADKPLDDNSEQPAGTDELPEDQAEESDLPSEPFVTWQAEEYATGEKSPIWYVGFFIVVLGLIALDLFFLRSFSFTVVIIVSVVALFLYFRSARTITYSLDATGLRIDDRLYRYNGFRSFGILDDGKRFSIILVPKKRFAHTISMFFPEDLGEQIVDIFGQRIPMEEVKFDLIDRIIKKLRI